MKLTKAQQDKMLEAKRAKENESEGRGRGGRGRGRGGGRGKTSAVLKAPGKKDSKAPQLEDQSGIGDNEPAEDANQKPEAPPLRKKGRQPKTEDLPTEPPAKKKKADKAAAAAEMDEPPQRGKRGKAAEPNHQDSGEPPAFPLPKQGKKAKANDVDGKNIVQPAAKKKKAAKPADNVDDCDHDSKPEDEGNQPLPTAKPEAPNRQRKTTKPASVEVPALPKKRGRPPKDSDTRAAETSAPGPKRKKPAESLEGEAEPSKRRKDVQATGSNGPKPGPGSPSKIERAKERKAMRAEFCIPDYHYCEVVMYWSRSAVGLKWRNTEDPDMDGKQAMQDIHHALPIKRASD